MNKVSGKSNPLSLATSHRRSYMICESPAETHPTATNSTPEPFHGIISGRKLCPFSNTTELHVDGMMTCNNCARKVTEAAQAVAGVHSVGVSVAAQHASVRWDSSGTINVPAVLAALTKAGYEAEEISAETNSSAFNRPAKTTGIGIW